MNELFLRPINAYRSSPTAGVGYRERCASPDLAGRRDSGGAEHIRFDEHAGGAVRLQSGGSKLLPYQYQHARENISSRLQSEVEIKLGPKGKGSILIHFNSEEEFYKLLSKMNPE